VVTVATPVHAYLRNYMSDLHQISLHVTCMSVARSSSGGVVIRYVVPVLLMTSRCVHNGQKYKRCNSYSVGSSIDFSP